MRRSFVWFLLLLVAAGCGAGGTTLETKDSGPITIRSTPTPFKGGGGPPPPP
ncbi:hypothetical protein [Armatimonas sp.]|uniref:hypothetical protein n=1 Tax=Armatimonas sp. TaxID=1872638 RepID=UPI00286BAD3C|nr:hypothetical protein [Armatimonas sp.]